MLLESHPNFLIVISYNPGYQSVMKDLKHSTRQRFVAIEFKYPSPEKERLILTRETGVGEKTAERLVRLGEMVRNLRQHGLEEGVSTRLLVYAAKLIADGVPPPAACEAAVTRCMSDDPEMQEAIAEIVTGIF
jgi:nitric oxide reductase NorQ protein